MDKHMIEEDGTCHQDCDACEWYANHARPDAMTMMHANGHTVQVYVDAQGLYRMA